jgi:hypothetical protein
MNIYQQISATTAVHSNLDSDLPKLFLEWLGGGSFTFQTFHDTKVAKKNPSLARVIQSPADDALLQLHARGAGIFVTVNETDGKGRRSENITRVRAVWLEDDNGFVGPFPLEPSMVVETSPGHSHLYWLVRGEWPADEAGRTDFAAVMERMVESYRSDKNAKDISRVLRVPGFLHRKNGTPHLVRLEVKRYAYTRAEILAAFPPVEKKDAQVLSFRPTPPAPNIDIGDVDVGRVVNALARINPDDRDVWLRMGMALKDMLQDTGRHIWDDWSRQSSKYDKDDQDATWKSLSREGITIATLFHEAKKAGWNEDGSYDYGRFFGPVPATPGAKDQPAGDPPLPLDIAGVFMDLGDAPPEAPKELIKKLLPAHGVAVTGGQSTAGKTFIQIYKAICLAAGLPYFGHRIVERVGTILVAAEGRSLIPNRFSAGLVKAGIADKLPISWIVRLPDFASAEGIKLFIAQLKEKDKQFRGDFGVRLGNVPIDTIAACFAMKDEDDNAEATKVCGILSVIGDEIGALMSPVHHFGKNPESGLRGASAWKGSADVVEGVLADIDPLTGRASNRELVLAKARDGEQGPLSPFELEWIKLGFDEDGDDYGSCAVVPTLDTKSRFDKMAALSKSQRAIVEAITEALDNCGQIITPRAGLDAVRAAKVTDVRTEFDRRYVVADGPADMARAKRVAFKRALDRLLPSQYGAGHVEGADWIWKM